MDQLKEKIQKAMKEKRSDLVLKNASYINVYTQTIEKGDIAICDGTIIGIGSYEGKDEIDCKGQYVTPGFIDSHVHIESAMVTPEIFSHIVLKKGVTTVIADPHEIANVMGKKGIELMLKNSQKAVMDIFYMLPSCVPAVSFEDNGATLRAKQLAKYMNHPKVLGLGEVMDDPAVIKADKVMLDKLHLAKKYHKNIDGHAPKLSGKALNAYISAGITTDHECTEPDEAIDKVKRGTYVMLREGSAAKDLLNLLPAVNDDNYHRFLFCTDDRHIEDLMEAGSIDNSIRLSIKNGMNAVRAYTMASFNAANCYGLNDRGAISPGMKADLVIFEDLENLNIKQVIKDGMIYQDHLKYSTIHTKKSVHVKLSDEALFEPIGDGEFVHVLKVHPGSLKTEKVIRNVDELEKYSINKIAVFERHHSTGKYFTGYIEGLDLKDGAIAQTIAHDSHNIIVSGDNEDDMYLALQTIIDQDGGIVFVSKGKVVEKISLPIAGIMTCEAPNILLEKMKHLNKVARAHGINEEIDPYITLSFMALPVIPELKITPRGLFDYTKFDFIDLYTNQKN